MNKPYIAAILAVTALSFSTAATAESMSKREYTAAEKQISSDCKSAMKNCDEFAHDEKGVCMAEARRTEKVAKAKLKASYKPSNYAIYEASVYKANAEYLVAAEKCNSMAGPARETCVTDTKKYHDQ